MKIRNPADWKRLLPVAMPGDTQVISKETGLYRSTKLWLNSVRAPRQLLSQTKRGLDPSTCFKSGPHVRLGPAPALAGSIWAGSPWRTQGPQGCSSDLLIELPSCWVLLAALWPCLCSPARCLLQVGLYGINASPPVFAAGGLPPCARQKHVLHL